MAGTLYIVATSSGNLDDMPPRVAATFGAADSFQAFLMMVCVAIYAVLVAGIQYSDNLSSSLFGVMAYTVILCYSLFKTASLSKSIFNAH